MALHTGLYISYVLEDVAVVPSLLEWLHSLNQNPVVNNITANFVKNGVLNQNTHFVNFVQPVLG